MRSPTAAEIAPDLLDVEADCAGLSSDADIPLDPDQIDWADVIAVMERHQLARLKRKFSARMQGKRLLCLSISDDYCFRQPELVDLLRQRLTRIAPLRSPVDD